MIFWELFYNFFIIGAFTFGGGYAMLTLIQNQVVIQHQWITMEQFTDIIAISQMTPGPIGINSTTYIGYSVIENLGYSEVYCILGSFLASFAVVLPSLFLVIWIAILFKKFKENIWVSSILRSIKPVIIGMLGAAVIILITPKNFIDWTSWALFGAAFTFSMFGKINPIIIIIGGGLLGILIY